MILKYFLQNNNIRLLFASETFIFILLGIWVSSYRYNCTMLVFPIIIWIVIIHSFIEVKIHERICFKNCYFKANSPLAKILSSRTFIIIIFMILSVVMTFSALYGILEFSAALWIYLVIHIAMSIAVYKYLTVKFRSMIKSSYLNIFAREWTIHIMAFIFILVFVYININGYEPEYLRNGLKETMTAASQTVFSQCDYLNIILKFQKEIDSIYWWVIHRSIENIEDTALKYFMWVIFLLMNSLAILGLNRFILQIIYLLNKSIIEDRHATE